MTEQPAKQPSLRLYSVVGIWVAAAVSITGFSLTAPNSEQLKVTFFETNRGDMIFVESPADHRMLVDGGDDPDLAISNLESVLPPLDRRIDVVLSTHPDSDHVGGLQRVVERFEVSTVIDSGVAHDSALFESWTRFIATKENGLVAEPGMVISLGSDVLVRVLQTECIVVSCSNFNDESVVVRLEYGEVSFLLTGDITSNAESDLELTGQHVRSTVLKAGHHGSRTSSSQGFLDAVDPALIVVTTGIKNQFGHPHEDVLTRLANEVGRDAVFVTRDRGTTIVSTNGQRLWVTSER